jgi:hypothetical protein
MQFVLAGGLTPSWGQHPTGINHDITHQIFRTRLQNISVQSGSWLGHQGAKTENYFSRSQRSNFKNSTFRHNSTNGHQGHDPKNSFWGAVTHDRSACASSKATKGRDQKNLLSNYGLECCIKSAWCLKNLCQCGLCSQHKFSHVAPSEHMDPGQFHKSVQSMIR